MSCHVSSCHVMSVQIQFVSCFISFTYLPCNSISKSNFVLPWNTKNKSYQQLSIWNCYTVYCLVWKLLTTVFYFMTGKFVFAFCFYEIFHFSFAFNITNAEKYFLYIFRKWIRGRINEVVVKWGSTVLGNWFQGLPCWNTFARFSKWESSDCCSYLIGWASKPTTRNESLENQERFFTVREHAKLQNTFRGKNNSPE